MSNRIALILLVGLGEQLLTAQTFPEPSMERVLYYIDPDGKKLTPVEPMEAKIHASRAFFTAEFAEPRAKMRLADSRPYFIIKTVTIPDSEADQMVKLDVANGKRIILLTAGKNGTGIPLPGKLVPTEFKQVAPSTFLIRPINELKVGEYAISIGKSNVAFLFGIEQGGRTRPEPIAEPTANPSIEASAQNPEMKERLRTLSGLLEKGYITKSAYDKKRTEIETGVVVAPTVEERIKRLDDLFKKGIIIKSDYDSKRAEILSEL